MIFLALLYAALSLHRIIENLKTDLVATRASAASRERLIWDWGMVGSARLFPMKWEHVRNNSQAGRLSMTLGKIRPCLNLRFCICEMAIRTIPTLSGVMQTACNEA